MSYNTSPGLFPGSQAAFAVRSDLAQPQFFISPQNSVLGIDLNANPVEGAESSARLRSRFVRRNRWLRRIRSRHSSTMYTWRQEPSGSACVRSNA